MKKYSGSSIVRCLLFVSLFAFAVLLASCGSSSSGDGNGGSSCTAGESCDNVAGSWYINENSTVTSGQDVCGSGETDSYYASVLQSGCNLTVSIRGNTFTGGMNGSSLCWSGSYPDEGGTTTITSLTATVSGNSLSGSSTWSWSGGGYSCSGSATFTGTMQ